MTRRARIRKAMERFRRYSRSGPPVLQSAGLHRVAGIAVDALKRAAAGGGFGKTVKAGMERGQALVQARVERRVRQSAQQRHDRLIGQIVERNKSASVTAERTAIATSSG